MWNLIIRLMAVCGAVASMVLIPAPPAEAQYFGRNKVQYRELDFEVLKTPHFDIYFYAEERDATANVGRMAKRWHARLSQLLAHSLGGRQPIILYVGGRCGDHVVPQVFDEALRAGPEAAFEKVLAVSARDLTTSWHMSIRAQYARILETTHRPADDGRALGDDPKTDRPLYASRVLSPLA